MTKKKWLSLFILIWSLLFHYEALRAHAPAFPKTPFLFPPSGWSMFYKIENSWFTAEIYGAAPGQKMELISPETIFKTPMIGIDTVRRNGLATVLGPARQNAFCSYLKNKFPQYTAFSVIGVYRPRLVPELPAKQLMPGSYQC